MKLIAYYSLLTNLIVIVTCQKFHQDQFSFTPHLQTPSSPMFSSEKSIYLPPESQTSMPYFTMNMNNVNKIPIQFLPPTGTKAPTFYSTAFPMISSTHRSNFDEEINNNDREDANNHRILVKHDFSKQLNNTNNNMRQTEKRELSARVMNFQPNFEKKQSPHLNAGKVPIQNAMNQNPASRRMIVTSEIQRTDPVSDQTKAASYQNAQYIQAPGVFISSTTEPAIPILRLSNEMDLDGSFSYEALGADQTHYVQHSHMENMGSEKEEQVVEGSYSYVGDDGRTYTVHYVADSNGYRATGEHLPVAPPIPEIIQRAIQYNLAEEAKRPPHLKASWESEDKDYDSDENKRNIFNSLPQRNLFTGRTPEAFSFGFSQGTHPQNNAVTASSYQIPTKSNFEIIADQSKPKNNAASISPQITFLASQGAHNPSSLQPQINSKASNTEKSSMPQLMNYEAELREPEQESNKALWRWQYGLNTIPNTNSNQNTNKNSISRSFGEGDDVIINFSDMTPDQYTQMIQNQFLKQKTEQLNTIENHEEKGYESPQSNQKPKENFKNDMFIENNINYEIQKDIPKINNPAEILKQQNIFVSTEKVLPLSQTKDESPNEKATKPFDKFAVEKNYPNYYSNIINRHSFEPQSQTVTQSYNFENTSQQLIKKDVMDNDSTINLSTAYSIHVSNNNEYVTPKNFNEIIISTMEPKYNNIDTTNVASLDPKKEINGFKPVIQNNYNEIGKLDTTTTEAPVEEMIKENIFLRNLFKPSRDSEKNERKVSTESFKQTNNNNPEPKLDKAPKYVQFQQNPENEFKLFKSKPLDMSDVLNYVAMKNHFESIKTKPKNKPTKDRNNNLNQREIPLRYLPIAEENESEVNEKQEQENDYKPNRQQQQELQGIIKNYKVLQRQKNGQKSQLIPEPQRHIKTFHTQGLPPLGRAGPSMKSYLPPTYL